MRYPVEIWILDSRNIEKDPKIDCPPRYHEGSNKRGSSGSFWRSYLQTGPPSVMDWISQNVKTDAPFFLWEEVNWCYFSDLTYAFDASDPSCMRGCADCSPWNFFFFFFSLLRKQFFMGLISQIGSDDFLSLWLVSTVVTMKDSDILLVHRIISCYIKIWQ